MQKAKRFILWCALALASCTSPVFAQFNNPGIPAQAAAGSGLTQNGATINIGNYGTGTALDNIGGLSGTGFLTRTGAGSYAFQSATNGITFANLAQAAGNTILANSGSSTGNVAAFTMPSCSGTTSGLQYTSNTGFNCNAALNSATLLGNSWVSPGAIGSTTPNTGAFTTGTASLSYTSPVMQTALTNYPAQKGSAWSSQYHANWNIVNSNIPYNPTEWQIYPNSANGIAQTQSGTNQLILQSGTAFSSTWVGLPYFYFNGTRYKVASVSGSTLTVQTVAGGAVTFPSTLNGTYYFSVTSTTSTVNVSGTAVTYVSGQPFVSIFDNGQVYINGTAYNATYVSPTSLTLGTSAGTLTGATLNQYANINNELSTLRLQGLNGANEENFAITERPDGTYLEAQYAGSGQYRPIFIATGENPGGTILPLISLYPAATLGNGGQLSLGGTGGTQAMQVNQNYNNVNYFNVQGAATGNAPLLSTAGSDATTGFAFGLQGANNYTFYSHGTSNTEFQIFGTGGTSWLSATSSASDTPTMAANGPDSNIGIKLIPKGTSPVSINGSITASGQGTMPLYGAAGGAQTSPHMVAGHTTLVGGTVAVTLSGSAVFTSTSSYNCTVSDNTQVNPADVVINSASQFTVNGTGTDGVNYLCVGN